jgi:N-acetylglutamate synthase-like GNAT family acetyltransferase
MSIPVDLALVRQLERAEGMANAASVDARHEIDASVGARWIEVAGAYAMFDGPESPLTQTFGIGIFEPFREREFESVEKFFTDRGAPTFHEVCSFAAPESIALLSTRGYSPIEASVVQVRPTDVDSGQPHASITVRPIDSTEASTWSRIAADGWSAEMPEMRAFMESMGTMLSRARGVTCFIAEQKGKPIATAALNVQNGVALMAGASTIPEGRRQGAQNALFNTRLAFARERGIELAMVVTQPGSASQRNAERQGFRPVYTRAKWMRLPG